jgi:hypothetical protein
MKHNVSELSGALLDAGYVARVVYEPINQPTESESK